LIPSLFVQDEITLTENIKFFCRLDNHGAIFTPRLAYKWKINDNNIVRFNTGTGFRIVNLFTEEHAALTGPQKKLKPERSYNANLNYLKMYTKNGTFIGLETSAWYTRFSNSIIPITIAIPTKLSIKI
jgi:outer membrane receptor for ferrienterochelin and colicins